MRLLPLLLLIPALAGCEKHEFEPPERSAQVAEADSLYAPALFDSIAWPGDSVRALEGNVVYATYCRKCHGPLGQGETEYAQENALEVPSLVLPDWQYAGDLAALRRRVFTGHEDMPTWGIAGITLREIDAVAFYLIDQLRPDFLGRP